MTNELLGFTPLVLLGLTSAFISFIAYLPYMTDTVAGRTRPLRASWLIWSVLSTVAFFSQWDSGASASLWFAGAQAGCTLAIFLLSIGRGVGGYMRGADALVLSGAALGLSLWYITDTAVYALGISIGISLLGGTVTIAKAYKDPDSETTVTWVASLVAAVMALFAVGKLDWVLMAYPLYLVSLNTAIVGAIWLGRAQPSLAEQRLSPLPIE